MIRVVFGFSLRAVGYPMEYAGLALWGDGLGSVRGLLMSPIALPLIGFGTGLGLVGSALQGWGEDYLRS